MEKSAADRAAKAKARRESKDAASEVAGNRRPVPTTPKGRLFPRRQSLTFIDGRNELHPKPSSTVPAFQIALQLIEWLTKSWAFLGSLAFGISALYLVEYKVTYAIPVAMTSGSVLAAWPVLFCFVFLATTALAICLISPSAVMWVGMDRQGRRLIDGHRSVKRQRLYNPIVGDDLGRAWIAAQVIGVGTLLVAISIYNKLPRGAGWLAWLLGAAAVALAIGALQGVRRRARITGLGAWLVGAVVIYAPFIQCISATVVFKFAFSLGRDNLR